MQYRRLGQTGMTVSRICLGCMSYGSSKWRPWVLNEDAARPFFRQAIERGINFFDTADMYSLGVSEEVTGRALRAMAKLEEIVIATKVFWPMGEGQNMSGLSRKHIMQACEASLRRLGIETIDLYQIHRFDPVTGIEDTLRALDDLVHAGKVRYIGCSNLFAWQLMKALAVSRAEGLERFKCTQSYYSLAGRELEREMIPLLKDQGLGLLVWSPLAGGFLSGKFTRDNQDAAARRATFDFPPVDKDRAYGIVEAMRTVADGHGVSVAQIALAWILAHDVVTSVIIGARKLEQLDDNLKSVDVMLSAGELKALDDASRLAPEYPAWMDRLPSDRRPGEVRRYGRQ